MICIPEANSPDVHNKSFHVTAEVAIPEKGADGVLATQGGRLGDWSMLVLEGKPTATNESGPRDSVIPEICFGQAARDP